MATGLALPIRVENGRVVRETGSAQLQKIIMLALADEDSNNPFQDEGIDPGVFDVNDENAHARYIPAITRLFKRLEAEGRARLLSGYPKLESDGEEMVATIRYIDLETDTPEEYQFRPSRPDAGGNTFGS